MARTVAGSTAGSSCSTAEKFAVQGGEEPGFGLGGVAQLAAFGRPAQERLLDQIAGIRLRAGQAEGEAVKPFIMLGHQLLEMRIRHGMGGLAGGIIPCAF
jgi:hypothetical protein